MHSRGLKDVFMFEKTGCYNGKYFVLNSLISPHKGINPEDTNIDQLIKKNINANIKEIILALNSSIEGETTALYIKKILENKNIKISRLSCGIPMGANIEYLDPTTIERALNDRKSLN